MKHIVNLLVINIVLVVIQTSYLFEFVPLRSLPNLVFVLLFVFLILRRFDLAYLQSLIGGVLLDCALGGVVSAAFLIGSALTLIVEKLKITGKVPLYVLFSGALLLYGSITYRSIQTAFSAGGVLLWTILIAILTAPLASKLVRKSK